MSVWRAATSFCHGALCGRVTSAIGVVRTGALAVLRGVTSREADTGWAMLGVVLSGDPAPVSESAALREPVDHTLSLPVAGFGGVSRAHSTRPDRHRLSSHSGS